MIYNLLYKGESMSVKKLTPFALACDTCGASLEFDIIKQNYSCQFCGNTQFLDSKKETVKSWVKKTNNNLQEQADSIKKYECPNCGADVKTMDDTESLKCFWCGSSMITAEFAQTDDYPVAVIPFKLTLEEAKALVLKELDYSLKQITNQQKKDIKENIKFLREVYLPFQLFSGTVDAKITRHGKYNNRAYKLKTYLNQKVIIACDNVDNDLVERVEPYNMDELLPFEFLYISGHQAKTQDITYVKLASDLDAELNDDMHKALSKKLGTEHLNVDVKPLETYSMPVLLPIFTLNIVGAELSINGQTGKIALKDYKLKVSHKWVIMPLLYTAIVGALAYYFGRDIPLTLLSVIVFGLIFYAIYSDANRRVLYNKFFASKQTYSRESGQLAEIGLKSKATFAPPVFYEKVDGKEQAVEIEFFPLRLKILIACLIVVAIFLPEVLYILLTPLIMLSGISPSAAFGALSISMIYTAAWKCLAIPLSGVAYFTIVKQGLYDRLYVRKYGSRDKFKYLKGSFPIFKKMREAILELLTVNIWLTLFIVFLLLVPVLMIYFEGAVPLSQ